MRIRFGPAGKPVNFKGPMEKVPGYLAELGLDALEYEAVRGVNIKEGKARLLGEEAEKYDILMSLHAPYFVNLAADKQETVKASIRRIVQSLQAAEWMNAYIVVFHPGYFKNLSREEALGRTIKALNRVRDEAKALGVSKPWLGPETTGKSSQIGSLEDLAEICSAVDRCRPTVDWAHLYARSEGRHVLSKNQVVKVIDFIEKHFGPEALKPLHQHFSRIEYGKGGERRHHVMAAQEYGPEFRHVCGALKELGVDSVIISESPLLDQDALVMKEICRQ